MQTVQAPPPPRKPQQRRERRSLLSTRGGTMFVALLTAILAAAVLMVFVSRYRDSVDDGNAVVTVLVAKHLIEEGSPGDVVAEDGMFQAMSVRKSELEDGAISDPDNLKGTIATKDIFAGDQLVADAFTTTKARPFNRLRGFDRAIAVPLDESHGLIGEIRTGDRVDVLAGIGLENMGQDRRPTLSVIMRNALVLKAPDKPKPGVGTANNSQPVLLRAPDRRAAQIAFAADVGKVWLVARPKAGARNSKVSTVDLQSLILGVGAKALEQADEYLEELSDDDAAAEEEPGTVAPVPGETLP
jgi:Flp pilus assembly protein CpaB